MTSIAAAIGIVALIGGLFVFIRGRYLFHSLGCLQYVWWLLGVTGGLIVAFLLEYALMPNFNKPLSLSSAIFAGIFLLYAVTLIGIAYMKPSLRQQINESVQRIMVKMPAKQISIAELVARLQREYKRSDTILLKYVEGLDYIEQVDLPGAPSTTVCRMKGTKDQSVFPQVANIASYDLRQRIERALPFLNEANVDIGLFLLSKEFEATLKSYLVEANTKGKLQILPPGKTSDKWSLNGMVDCAKDNSIIADSAVFHYLRQERNNRAHGVMPSLAEKHLLLKNVQYIAGLYIDYIKLLDDLTRCLIINPTIALSYSI